MVQALTAKPDDPGGRKRNANYMGRPAPDG